MSWTITEFFTWYFYVYSLCTIYCDHWSCDVFGFLSMYASHTGICKGTKICSFFLHITHTVTFSDMILLICKLFSFGLYLVCSKTPGSKDCLRASFIFILWHIWHRLGYYRKCYPISL